MFIYKIVVNNKEYYGLDTKPVYKQNRWKTHKREAAKNVDNIPLHTAMNKHGIENCVYEVVEEGFSTIQELALAEMRYISENDTYRNGLNSTCGGDGLGHQFIWDASDNDIQAIKDSLSTAMSDYNTHVKWAGMSAEERKVALSHLHTEEVALKKSVTLKEYYANNPKEKQARYKAISKWRDNNREQLCEQNRKASMIGAAAVSKKVKVEFDNGEIKVYNSKSAYAREHGYDLKYIIEKTRNGGTHNGKRAWEI